MKYNDTGYSPTDVYELYYNNMDLSVADVADITGYTEAQVLRILKGASR